MFQFSRPTLWIIINVTMLMVILLNFVGSDPEEPFSIDEPPTSSWAIANIEANCDDQRCVVPLTNADNLTVSFITKSQPAGQVAVPVDLPVQVSLQGGLYIVTSQLSSLSNLATAIEFYERWLPANDDVRWALTGATDESWAQEFVNYDFQFSGLGEPIVSEPVSALGRLTAPRLGNNQQLAFLMWIEVLRTRLDGYNTEARWDHRAETSIVLFNSTLSSDVFYPITEAELEPILSVYKSAADKPLRNSQQIHRYLQSAMVYQLPISFFTEQSQRLNEVTLGAVNIVREQSLGQITQP